MSLTRQACAGNSLCHKCGGLLVVERVLDFYGPIFAWKCVNCGWFHRESQRSQPTKTLGKRRVVHVTPG